MFIVAAMDKSNPNIVVHNICADCCAMAHRLHRKRWLHQERSTHFSRWPICVDVSAILHMAYSTGLMTFWIENVHFVHYTKANDNANCFPTFHVYFQHMLHFTKPILQKPIIRILWMVPIYSGNAVCAKHSKILRICYSVF